MKLVIVESPAKAKTIAKFLGKGYEVVASYGHIRDLPGSAAEVPEEIKSKPWSRMAVDIENDFQPYYVVPAESKKRVAELRKLVKDADEVVLATDEDREGESISWHLLQLLKPKVPVKRIAFHEITKSAIDEAIANPRDVDDKLVRAQESRRILDRLYGYSLSPVLWKKVRPNLSAGRVQSVAVRLVVEREEERRAFIISEYWDVEAQLSANGLEFPASLVSIGGSRLASGKDFDSDTGKLKKDKEDVIALNGEHASRVSSELKARLPWRVARVEQKKNKQRPWPPFITSTLQQGASSLLGMSPAQTMRVAQRLYEGIDLGGADREGLITYMRTDSVTLSERALAQAGAVIRQRFGDKYYEGPRRYTTKSKSAQEAHEAIRPTDLNRTPEQLSAHLSKEDLALYRLIYNRTLASQMADAELLKTAVDFEAQVKEGKAVLRANGSVVAFPGHLAIADSAQKDAVLPPIEEGQEVGPGKVIALLKTEALRHETQPPARYTEASLVRRLEEEGIGRPSTYAPTISTIQARGYVVKRGNSLAPTFLGVAVTQLLRKHFTDYVDLGFTARMEDALDGIAQGENNWIDFLGAFYHGHGQYGPGLEEKIASELPEIDFPTLLVGEDPESHEPIVVRLGRTAPFIQRGEGGAENTATLPEETGYDELTVEKALELLKGKARGNEPLGTHPETGENIYALLGPYGPYIQLGESDPKSKKKPQRVSLPKDTALENVELETALKYLSLPRDLGKHPATGDSIVATLGRFGPYLKCGAESRSLGGHDALFSIDLAGAVALLAEPKRTRASKILLRDLGANTEGATVGVYEGRYGPYVTDGKVNASLPKGSSPEAITLDEANALLENAPKGKKRAAGGRKPAAKKAPAKKATAKATTKKRSAKG